MAVQEVQRTVLARLGASRALAELGCFPLPSCRTPVKRSWRQLILQGLPSKRPVCHGVAGPLENIDFHSRFIH